MELGTNLRRWVRNASPGERIPPHDCPPSMPELVSFLVNPAPSHVEIETPTKLLPGPMLGVGRRKVDERQSVGVRRL